MVAAWSSHDWSACSVRRLIIPASCGGSARAEVVEFTAFVVAVVVFAAGHVTVGLSLSTVATTAWPR